MQAIVPELRFAVFTDIDPIMSIFRLYPETKHKRRDFVSKMITLGNVIFEDEVVWILCKTKRRIKWGDTAELCSGDVADHGIASANPGNGAASRIASILFNKLDELRLSFWVSMRVSNTRCISFMSNHNAVFAGNINWNHGQICGQVMCRRPASCEVVSQTVT